MSIAVALNSGNATAGRQTVETVLVVSNLPVIRLFVKSVIDAVPGYRCCAETAACQQAAELASELEPDSVFVDLSMDGGSGLELVRQMQQRKRDLKILISACHEDYPDAGQARSAGVMGYLRKQDGPAELVAALRSLSAGESYFRPEMSP